MSTLQNCPWCGGGLTDDSIAVAKTMRAKMALSVSRRQVDDLSERTANMFGHPAESIHSQLAVQQTAEDSEARPHTEICPTLQEVRLPDGSHEVKASSA
jgi:hypothetical protein